MIRKLISLFSLLFLIGCSVEDASESEQSNQNINIPENTSFILRAAEGFVKHTNYETPHTYVVDRERNEVYVGIYSEPSGLTPAEIIEQAQNDPVEQEHPIFEIEFLTIEDNNITLEYDTHHLEFITLSKSYLKDQNNIWYTIDPYASGIDGYIQNLRGQ